MMSVQSFMRHGKASVIVGGQFGSEAKGLAAAMVAKHDLLISKSNRSFISTTNAGAQAGHTTVLEDGRKFVCYHLPTIGVMSPNALIYLNAGSIIDPGLLTKEIISVCEVTGENPGDLIRRIRVHPNAAIIHQDHKEAEAGDGRGSGATTHLGSTMKGVGAALASKIMRKPNTIARDMLNIYGELKIEAIDLNNHLACHGSVTVEIPQGTGLSLNASRFYPHCTSRDCWVGQGMADAGIHPSFLGEVMMVQRTFPIRVGHVYHPQTGERIGDSGPFYPDGPEISWDDLPGVEPERTTVTQRVRRIASWSKMQYLEAMRLNRPTIVLTTFINYLHDERYLSILKGRMDLTHDMLRLYPETLWSWGPRVDQWTDDIETARTKCQKGK